MLIMAPLNMCVFWQYFVAQTVTDVSAYHLFIFILLLLELQEKFFWPQKNICIATFFLLSGAN
jgi:hypothetical protein